MMNRAVVKFPQHPKMGFVPKKKSNRQKVWEYARRNRVFRVGDVLSILEVSESSLQLLLRQLLKAKYVKLVESKRAFRDKKYKLVVNTGVVCPSVVKAENVLWDSNIKEKIFIGGSNGKKETFCSKEQWQTEDVEIHGEKQAV